MKRLSLCIPQIGSAVLLAFATSTAMAQSTIVFDTTLLGSNEVPSVTTPGSGTAIITLDEVAMTMRVQASFEGLLGNVTAAHIHCCTALPGGASAGVATPLPSFPGFPSGGQAGNYDQTLDMSLASSWNNAFVNLNGGTLTSAFEALSTGLSEQRGYFNLHTSSFPGGEIRGTLTTAVPEPSSMALLAIGLAVVGGAAGLRRKRSHASPYAGPVTKT